MKEFLKESNINHVLYIVEDGAEALKFVHTHCKPAKNYCLDIIILDLNLPKKSGIEVLKEIKINEDLKRIPVTVLTISTEEEDIKDCYGNYANCYIVKSSKFGDFENIMNIIKEFWFNTSNLPK